MINKLKEKKGQISVTMVIFIMVLCYMLASMIDIGNRQWGLRETQTKIDIAGMNALYNSVNLDSLRLEVLDIGGSGISSDGTGADSINSSEYENKVRDEYRRELSAITYGGTRPEIRYTKVDFEYSNTGLGFKGSSAKSRPQVLLESIVSYTVDSSLVTDRLNLNKGGTVTSSLSNTSFTITVQDTAEDGMALLLIHSETKLVLK